jgi:hypothetical protein
MTQRESWQEAFAAAALMFVVAGIGVAVGALIGLAFGRPDIGAAVGWAPAVLAWVCFGAYLASRADLEP